MFLIIAIPLFLVSSNALATTWTIEPDGSGDAPTIQAGVDSAAPGDTVLLADGTFTGDGNRDVDFLGKDIVVRAESGHPSKGREVTVIDCEGSSSEPHRAFLLVSGEGPSTVVEGMTIQNGYHFGKGGAILIRNGSSPTIRDIWFHDNHSGERGGGLYCRDDAVVTIENCIFRRNSAGSGGAVYGSRVSLTLVDVYFEENSASGTYALGGAMGCDSSSTVSLLRAHFFRNTAPSAGGLFTYLSGADLVNCEFIENEATSQYAGGIYSYAGGFLSAVLRLTDCRFERNHAVIAGGGAFMGGLDDTIERCTFTENNALYGGAAAITSRTDVLDCLFERNEATIFGGALSIQSCIGMQFTRCVFRENDGGGMGGAFHLAIVQTSMTECTFHANEASAGSGIYLERETDIDLNRTIVAFGVGGEGFYDSEESNTINITCTDIYGNAGGDWIGSIAGFLGTAGNFSAAPIFCGPPGDLTLRSDSPCLPGNHPDGASCDVIGAFSEGCTGPTSTEPTSWTKIKSMFR